MKILRNFLLLVAGFFVACSSTTSENNVAPPLVDGHIEEYAGLGVEPILLDPDVHLYFYQDDHYVWIAYDYNEGSWGTLDMEIESPNLDGPLNLHISAQIGEWPINNPELAPDSPESERWWNANGWYANEVWANGMDRSGEEPRYKFKNAGARELQLSKARFGKGEWKIKMKINAVVDKEGNRSVINFPNDGSTYSLTAS